MKIPLNEISTPGLLRLLHDLAARVQRLMREGVEWHQRNP